jgi:hypothetical protein
MKATLAGALFVVVATANGAGYRYGASDQAFYIPVITRALDASLFPRDAAVIDAEGRLMLVDEVAASLIRITGLSLESTFLLGYLLSMGLLWAGLILIGTRVYRSTWAVAALGAAFTMRHRIPRTSANSFEPYFQPRMLAFSIGTLAVAAVVRRRPWTAVALVAAAALIHVTIALWFAVLIGVALAVLHARFRRLGAAAAIGAAIALIVTVAAGPLQGSLIVMDDIWLEAVASKDSLFATQWPAWAWAGNLGFLGLLWWVHRRRMRHGDATAEDAALVWGATALVALFLATLPLIVARVSLPVQFQISRVFWLVEFIALIYAIALAVDRPPVVRRAGIATLLAAIALSRGAYVMLVERPERPLFQTALVDSPWENAMRWVAAQPKDVHVLADPGHAWKYGTSVRVSAQRDVLVEEVKDSALAIYSREVAGRYVDRVTAIGDFSALTTEHAQGLAHRYGLDYLVTEADLPLPAVYRNEQFRIYALRR